MNKLFIIASLFLFISCSKERISGSGPVTTENRSVNGFTKVSASGSNNVHISQGANFSVQVKGYSNLLPYFETEVRNNTLELHYRNNVSIRNDNVEVFVVMPVLEGAKLSGSSSMDIKGVFTSNTLNTSISGSGNMDIEAGAVQFFDADISGSGNIRAFGLTADRADVSISGSGTTEVKATTHLKASISGSGTIYYKGSPVIESSVSGSGKLVHRP